LAASLAGVAALYVGAVAIDKVLYFWIVIGAGAILPSIKPGFKSIVELAIRFRNYPKILKRVATAENEIETLKSRLREAEDNANEAWRSGLQEGYARTMGAVLSVELGRLPEIVGIIDDSGTVALVGQYDESFKPRTMARFKVVSQGTGDLKGVVEVTRIDHERLVCFLRCINPTAEKFWAHLASRASYDESAPSGVILERYELEEDEDIVDSLGLPYTSSIEVTE
jgi:hypothetical protein